MARPKEQTARRGEIVAAARRAIRDRGLAGLRIKDVAREAGLSPGSVSYYYGDFDDLLADVHQDAVDRFYWQRLHAIEAVGDPAAQLAALVRAGVPAGADDETFRVLYELHVHAARNRTHAVLMTALYDREVSLYQQVLRALGLSAEAARTVAENAVALEDAYGLHLVGRNAHVSPASARANILSYLTLATAAELEG
ncbi:TetR family transcriptional regulator [Paractinoplanes deccanensis]|uniref:TetR family transcriptional regulator n=1 Tax=Paractinoplanes deccanensis TaxID=113561 RepID=A0ABQ3XZ61_9ACTN|nr:TetR family transcriptional regulator [Actinoplanes deccanensis]GID73022.1 TetR family transcriptional regulator [Actinoplanes deccanensis]